MTSSIVKAAIPGLGLCLRLLAIATAVGCGSSSRREGAMSAAATRAYLQDKPAELHPLYMKVATEGQRNYVLNELQAGLAAMELDKLDLAERSFENALLRIESVYANNAKAAKARSLWYEEGMKDFKGEPYERAMAYYYRGLLYLRRGDFENARACYKAAVLQDAFAEEKQNRCDFALMVFLQGWASQCLGDKDMAAAAYEEVKRLRPDFATPRADHNVLIIVETGTSPRKLADGVGHYVLVYRRGKGFTEKKARVKVAGQTRTMYPMEDIAWQAMTRGGRPVDKILKGQVVFRERSEKIGTILTEVSSNAMLAAPAFHHSTSEVQAVSAALGLIGVAQLVIAQKVNPRADTRYWGNLPDAVHVWTGKLAPGEQAFDAAFLDASGRSVSKSSSST